MWTKKLHMCQGRNLTRIYPLSHEILIALIGKIIISFKGSGFNEFLTQWGNGFNISFYVANQIQLNHNEKKPTLISSPFFKSCKIKPLSFPILWQCGQGQGLIQLFVSEPDNYTVPYEQQTMFFINNLQTMASPNNGTSRLLYSIHSKNIKQTRCGPGQQEAS